MTDVTYLTNEEDFDKHLELYKDVVVKLTAPSWCAPCRQFAPHFERAAAQLPDTVFISIDIDHAPWAAERFGVLSVPTVKRFVDDSEPIDVKSRTVVALILELRSTHERRL